jgi:predicted HTH domain antitoxin
MKTVEIELSDQAVLGLDRDIGELADELRAAAAAKLYEIGRVSLEIGAEIAGMSRSAFISYLSRLRVSPMQETADEALAGARLILGE